MKSKDDIETKKFNKLYELYLHENQSIKMEVESFPKAIQDIIRITWIEGYKEGSK